MMIFPLAILIAIATGDPVIGGWLVLWGAAVALADAAYPFERGW